MDITVEHGIPKRGLGAGYKRCEVPFQKLGVGDSFLVSCESAEDVIRKSQWMRNQAKKYRKESGHKDFAISIAVEGNNYRVWRVA